MNEISDSDIECVINQIIVKIFINGFPGSCRITNKPKKLKVKNKTYESAMKKMVKNIKKDLALTQDFQAFSDDNYEMEDEMEDDIDELYAEYKERIESIFLRNIPFLSNIDFIDHRDYFNEIMRDFLTKIMKDDIVL